MSTVVQRIGEYVADLKYDQIPQNVLDYTKSIFVDSLACVYGGFDNEPYRMTRKTVGDLGGNAQATVFGSGEKTSAQLAALVNGVAMRYQDYNDTYMGAGWTGHPSDNISTLIAVAEWHGRSGKDLLLAMLATYEVNMRFQDLPGPKLLWHRGWHHSLINAYAAAAGVSVLLGLNGTQTAHAMALAGARSNTFSEIRHGEIPMDKALSAPIIASQTIIYALLAQQGFTGCTTLLEGPYGFRPAITGDADVEFLVPKRGQFDIMKVGLKPYPVEGMTPAMVQAAAELRTEHKLQPDEIESVVIRAHKEALTKPSWDEKKLKPSTKETADHSFYFCVAMGLVAGEVDSAHYSDKWLADKTIQRLMANTTMVEKPELTALFKQGARPAGVEVKTKRGTFYREVPYPHGDPHNPMTPADIGKKFKRQAEATMGAQWTQEAIDRGFAIEKEANVKSFAELLGGKKSK